MGNVVSTDSTDSTVQVTVAINSGEGGTLSGTATDCVVTFNDLTLTGTVSHDYTLNFTVDVLTAAMLDAFRLTGAGVLASWCCAPVRWPG